MGWGVYQFGGDGRQQYKTAVYTAIDRIKQAVGPEEAAKIDQFLSGENNAPDALEAVVYGYAHAQRDADPYWNQWNDWFRDRYDSGLIEKYAPIAAKLGLVTIAALATYGVATTAAGGAGAAGGASGGIGASGSAGGAGIGAGASAGAGSGVGASGAAGSAAASSAGSAASAGGLRNLLSSQLGRSVLQASVGALINKFSGHPENALRSAATAPYESKLLQGFLPPALRDADTGDILKRGVAGIGELIRNPGGLSPTVAAAIAPRLAAESESIAQNFRGIASNQSGAAARGNLPVSIKNALSSALDVAQERAQRGARREALLDSESLRRSDLSRTGDLLNSILQFQQSGRGGAIQGIAGAADIANRRQASNLAFLGSLFGQAANP